MGSDLQAKDVLLGQIEMLRQDLLRASRDVESPEIDEQLRKRVAARFDLEFSRLKTRTTELRAAVDTGQSLGARWRDLQKLQGDAGKILEESLAFVQGSLARNAKLDNGICALTDDLLDDLAELSDVKWGRFTLLATGELYKDIAEIIRIRYPEISLWSVPLAAHEFGHYAGPELRHNEGGAYAYPFQALLRTADEIRPAGYQLRHTKQWHDLQEYFADLFATYTLGPAYAAAFLFLRVNPSDAHQDLLTHPASARRMHGILWALDQMDAREATPLRRPFRDVTGLLRELWQVSLRQAGQPEKLPDAEAASVTQRMSELWRLLTDATPGKLALDRAAWLRVESLAGDLAPQQLPDGSTHREVLNAAWLARLQSSDQNIYALNDIVSKALATYQRI